MLNNAKRKEKKKGKQQIAEQSKQKWKTRQEQRNNRAQLLI